MSDKTTKMDKKKEKSKPPQLNYPSLGSLKTEKSAAAQERPSDLAKRCQPCLIDETKEVASSFCVDCIEYLCLNCKREHRKNKATRCHRILEEKNMPSDHSPFSKIKELMLCTEHSTSEVVYKCKDHDQFICVACLAVSHRKCENVVELSKCHVYESLHEKFEKLQKEATENKIFSKQNLENIRTCERKILKESSDFTQTVVQKLLQMDEKLKFETKELVETKCKELETNVERCEKLEQEANSCLQGFDIVKQYGNTEQFVVLSNHFLKRAKHLDKENMNYSDRNVESLKLEKNSLLEGSENLCTISFVKLSDSDSVNQSKVSLSSDELSLKLETESPNNALASTNEPSTKPGTGKQQMTLLQRKIIKSSFDFSLRSHSDEKECSVTGFAKLNGRLAAIDKNNIKLKIFNENYILLCERKLSGDPLDVCSVSDCVALIIDNVKLIKLYQVAEKSIVKKSELPMNNYPLSIAEKNDWEAYVLCSEQPCVAVDPRKFLEIEQRDLRDGKILKKFNVYKHMSYGYDADAYRIHYSCKGKIIVSEYQTFFTFLDKRGNLSLQWFYKSHGRNHLYDISDIGSDDEGNVYVCGTQSKNVHQVSDKNCFQNRLVSCASAGKPSALCLDLKNSRLLVALHNKDRVWAIEFEK